MESRLLRRLHLHLNTDLNQLSAVTWTPVPERYGIQLAATAIDGVREHLWIRVGLADRVWKLDALLRQSFSIHQTAWFDALTAADGHPSQQDAAVCPGRVPCHGRPRLAAA
jgi:hypothetical protein